MTFSGFYDTAVILSAVGLLAVAAGWSLENWPRLTGWWANRKQRRALRKASRKLVAKYRELEADIGSTLLPAMAELGKAVTNAARSLEAAERAVNEMVASEGSACSDFASRMCRDPSPKARP